MQAQIKWLLKPRLNPPLEQFARAPLPFEFQTLMRRPLFILCILASPFGCSGGIPAGTPGFDPDGDTHPDATSSRDPPNDGIDTENNSQTSSDEGTSAGEETQDDGNSDDGDSATPSASDETSTPTDTSTTAETPTSTDTEDNSDTSSDSSDEEKQLPCQSFADAGTLRLESIATWKNGVTGACSIMHDDLCGWGLDGIHLDAVDELQKRGLVAGLGAYVKACQERSLWSEVRAAQAMGHEIVNHSYTHSQVTVANSNQEVQKSRDVLNTLLETPVEFFAFPFDAWNDQTITAVALAGNIGARAGSRDDNDGTLNPPINTSMPQNDLAIEFDVWPREYSKYMNYTPANLLDMHVHHAIEKKDGPFASCTVYLSMQIQIRTATKGLHRFRSIPTVNT